MHINIYECVYVYASVRICCAYLTVGAMPECMGELTNLQDLRLSRNRLTGNLHFTIHDIHMRHWLVKNNAQNLG